MIWRRILRDEEGSEAPSGAQPSGEPAAPETNEFAELADFEMLDGGESKDLPNPRDWFKPAPASGEPKPEAAAPASVPTPKPEAQSETPKPVSEPTQPATPAQPTEPVRVPAYTPEQITALRNDALGKIEKTYGFSEQEAVQLQTEPEKVLPRLAAQLHLNIFETVYTAMVQNLPALIDGRMNSYTAQTKNEDSFFEKWPELRNDAAIAQVKEIGDVYNRLHPNAPIDKWILDVGAMTMQSLGLQRQARPPAATSPSAPPVIQRPFAPANPGGAVAGPPVPTTRINEWEAMLNEFDEAERRT